MKNEQLITEIEALPCLEYVSNYEKDMLLTVIKTAGEGDLDIEATQEKLDEYIEVLRQVSDFMTHQLFS